MLLILAAGGTVVAAAARWLRKHPGRIEEELVAIYREAYLEVRDESRRGEEAKPSPLTALDTRYQRFVVEKVDPLLSRTRQAGPGSPPWGQFCSLDESSDTAACQGAGLARSRVLLRLPGRSKGLLVTAGQGVGGGPPDTTQRTYS